ncbi:MAG: 23S rRNA (pseudouridine(1915)-N(3))-methyltransferase RlmH [Saprospiraceae bacterium]|nr:23S rRNA (pseudouridine(1915)-N(3))-methyltransferase RlmH [Saprospiraceae bacterium]
MRIEIWTVGKTRSSWIREGMQVYLKRIGRFARVSETIIAAEKSGDDTQIIQRESARILAQLEKAPQMFTFLLDETGKQWSSPELAGQLDAAMHARGPRLRFIIGGAYGVNDEVKQSVDSQLSLSRLTFPHELVRVIFLEQLYRAFTILRGESYHHT